MWCLLGVDPDVVRILSTNMRLHWKDGRLQVLESYLAIPNSVEDLSSTLLSLWGFRSFTLSRWGTVGRSARGILVGRLTGFHHLVELLRQEMQVSGYYTAGADQLNGPEVLCVAVAAVCSHVPEGLIYSLLQDGRLLLQLDQLEESMQTEVQMVEELDGAVWKLLGDAASVPGSALRDASLQACHIAWAFLQYRIFKVARSPPWNMLAAHASEREFTAAVQDMAGSPDPTVRKIMHLHQLGYNHFRIRQAMALMRQCNWTSASAERQHASAATVRKFHADIGAPMLIVRSFIHGLQQLMPSKATADEKRLRQVQMRLDKALAARPRAITGRHVYLQDIFLKAQQKKETGAHGEYDRFKIMKLHSSYYLQLGSAEKAALTARAEVLQAEAVQRQHQEVAQLLADLQEVAAKVRKVSELPSMRLAACRLSSEELLAMAKECATLSSTKGRVHQSPTRTPQASHCPTACGRDGLSTIEISVQNAEPGWTPNQRALERCYPPP